MAEFEFDGRTIKLLAQHEIELGDLAFIKQHFDICGLVDLENGMGDMDPTAWRAILIASIRRVQPEVSPTHGGIDSVAIVPLIEALNADRAAYLDAQAAALEEQAEALEGRARPTTGPRQTRARSGARS